MEDKNWILGSLNIHQDWQKPNVYKGSVNFKNNIKLEFNMLLDSEKCARIMAIISEEIVESAKTMSQAMINSMPIALPPPPPEATEAEEAN
jgi:hypothetical protein